MSLAAVRCETCGGAVAFDAARPQPECLFCGAARLVEVPLPEGVEPPEGWLAFTVDEAAARAAFRAWASSSFWYPNDLRHATLDLHALLVPAWSWSGRVETHWAALVPASTRSGKRPLTGVEERDCTGVLIPSSQALSRSELDGLSPFAEGEVAPLDTATLPHEIGSLTRTAARQRALAGMEALHGREIQARVDALEIRTAAVGHGLRGRPLLLPVWIGAYRRKDKVFRVVINGQSGRLVGAAPISWVKVAAVVALVGVVVMALAICLGLGGFAASRG